MIVFGIIIAGGGYFLRDEGNDVLRRAFNPESAQSLRAAGFLGLVLGVILIVVGLIRLTKRS